MIRSSEMLNVVVDDRIHIERMDDMQFIHQYSRSRHMSTRRQIFKDYILSSESFEIGGQN